MGKVLYRDVQYESPISQLWGRILGAVAVLSILGLVADFYAERTLLKTGHFYDSPIWYPIVTTRYVLFIIAAVSISSQHREGFAFVKDKLKLITGFGWTAKSFRKEMIEKIGPAELHYEDLPERGGTWVRDRICRNAYKGAILWGKMARYIPIMEIWDYPIRIIKAVSVDIQDGRKYILISKDPELTLDAIKDYYNVEMESPKGS